MATPKVIQNYTVSCRTNLQNTNYGPSNLKYIQDGTGRITDVSGNLEGASDGRSITFPLTVPVNYMVTKSIKSAEGDKSLITITHTDDTTTELT